MATACNRRLLRTRRDVTNGGKPAPRAVLGAPPRRIDLHVVSTYLEVNGICRHREMAGRISSVNDHLGNYGLQRNNDGGALSCDLVAKGRL